MTLPNQTLCKCCGAPMKTVARVPSVGGQPGLTALLCPDCGAAESNLVYPEFPAWSADEYEDRDERTDKS
jgi:hypothetical protein